MNSRKAHHFMVSCLMHYCTTAITDKDFIHHVYFFKRNLLNFKVKLVILKLCLFLLLLLTHVYFSCRLFHVCKKISLFSDLYLWFVFYHLDFVWIHEVEQTDEDPHKNTFINNS